MSEWFARPVLHVLNVDASLRFYVDRLGFTVPWRVEEKVGKGLIFISLNVEPHTHDAEVAAVDALRAELEARGVSVKEGHWGYRVLVIEDLNGNQLFFPYPNEPGLDPEGLRRT